MDLEISLNMDVLFLQYTYNIFVYKRHTFKKKFNLKHFLFIFLIMIILIKTKSIITLKFNAYIPPSIILSGKNFTIVDR